MVCMIYSTQVSEQDVLVVCLFVFSYLLDFSSPVVFSQFW